MVRPIYSYLFHQEISLGHQEKFHQEISLGHREKFHQDISLGHQENSFSNQENIDQEILLVHDVVILVQIVAA